MAPRGNRNEILDTIHNQYIDIKNRIIYLHAHEEDDEIDYRVAASFVKNLDYLNNLSNEEITIKIFNPGGCWYYGMAIYDAIINSRSFVTTVSYGFASSMSSIIPQAADKRLITKNSTFMMHYGSYEDSGDFRKVYNSVKYADSHRETMISIYANKCVKGQFAQEHRMDLKKTFNFIKNRIDKTIDWWMSAEESIYYGFMDEIL